MAGRACWAQQLGMSLSLLTDNRAETLAGPLPAKWCIKDRTEAALTGPCHLRTSRSSGFRSEIRGLEWLRERQRLPARLRTPVCMSALAAQGG